MERPPSFLRETADHMRAASGALATWEIEAGRAIFASPGRLVLLAAFCIPAFLFVAASTAWPAATSSLTDALPAIGGSKALMPATVDTGMFLGSMLVGLIAGLITGVIGAGGGYILTPALMSFGVRGIMAVGTDQFHLFAKAIMGTTIHSKLGNVSLRLAVWFVVGSLVGVTAGGTVNRAIYAQSPALSDAVISLVYVVVLGFLGFYAVADWRRARRRRQDDASAVEATTDFARRLQRLPLRPRITFDRDVVEGGRSISVYPVIVCGLIVGFIASIMGVGGGFLTFPMFVYGLGVSTFTTVGTDILQIIFTTAYSSIFQYAIYGFVFYSVAVGMLLGSLVGVQVGALVTTKVTGSQIRAFFALTILAGFTNRLCALPKKLDDLGYVALSSTATGVIEDVGTVVFFGIVGVFAVWIMAVFFRDVVRERTIAVGEDGRHRRLASPRRFALGAGLLGVFAVVLAGMLLPLFGGQNLLAVSDELFNERAKVSTDVFSQTGEKAAGWTGTDVDLGVSTGELADPQAMLDVVAGHAETSLTPDGRVRVIGNLGGLAEAAIVDAEALFKGETARLEQEYPGLAAPEAVYAWWLVFDGLSRRYVQENRADEAAFTKLVATKVLEPAYNFRGIEVTSSGESTTKLAALLVFYVGYTVLYGLGIMFLFEGLGISATHGGNKLER